MKKFFALFEEYLPAILMVVTSLMIFVQVVLRYVFSKSLIWADEFARYGIVWFVFLGSSLAVHKGAHASVDVLVKLLPNKARKVMEIVGILISIFFCLLVTYYGIQMVVRIREIGNITPALQIPMYIPYMAIPIGCAMMAFRYIQELVVKCKTPSEKG